MSSEIRFFGPILSSAEHRSVFAGDNEGERMSLVRKQIVKVRQAWQDNEDYKKLVETVRNFIRPETQPESIRDPINRMLQGFRDYADVEFRQVEQKTTEQYDALELYCSKEGYDYLYRLISKTLRLDQPPDELLLTAVALIEFLTIDLYNLRLSQIGDPRYENFQGITYRGLRVDENIIDEYQAILAREDLKKRNFSIPVAPISSTVDPQVMKDFAKGSKEGSKEDRSIPMFWKIHIHGIHPDLLQEYLRIYPDSIVTSICSMPVAPISPFGEKEILLRGVSFQALHMTTEQYDGQEVHQLEVVTINANRDHTTEIGLNEGQKKMQRDAFRRIATASKYEVCASIASKHSDTDPDRYRALRQEILDELRSIDGINFVQGGQLSSARSDDIAVWHGGALSGSYSRHLTTLRQEFHDAVSKGQWAEAEKILRKEYDWRRGDWYNIAKLNDHPGVIRPSFTLLHELAIQDRPGMDDEDNYAAWQRLVDDIDMTNVWKTLRTYDDRKQTAAELAQLHGHEWLSSRLTPIIRVDISSDAINDLERQLHLLMVERAGNFIDYHTFHMPQLVILTEIGDVQLWIPIPHMYGGFSVNLVGCDLHVKIFETIPGQVRPKMTALTLKPHEPNDAVPSSGG